MGRGQRITKVKEIEEDDKSESQMAHLLLFSDQALEEINSESWGWTDEEGSLLTGAEVRLQLEAFACLDCQALTDCEYYMIHDPLWEEVVGKDGRGMLCIGCLETRLGRRVDSDDFTDAPINQGLTHMSRRLRDRLGG